MSEGLELVLRVAFRVLKLHRVEANVQPANRRSLSLVRRAGFVREGYSRRYVRIAGRWRDHVRMALLVEDWRARRRKASPMRPGLPLIVVTLALVRLCRAVITAGTPKVVRAHPLPSYQIHEECLTLEPGDRVEYEFESTEPVDFNVHYHEGKAVVMPVVREKSRADAGIYAVQIAQDYCLMWEAGRRRER